MRSHLFAALFTVALAPAAMAADGFSATAPDGNVVEFHVLTVSVPSKLPNHCTVTAMIAKVWQGTAYRAGQPVLLNVPCAEYGLVSANARDDGFTPVNARTLQQSQRGIARLDDRGELIWSHEGLRQYGLWGAVAGYRVLDTRMLPTPIRS